RRVVSRRGEHVHDVRSRLSEHGRRVRVNALDVKGRAKSGSPIRVQVSYANDADAGLLSDRFRMKPRDSPAANDPYPHRGPPVRASCPPARCPMFTPAPRWWTRLTPVVDAQLGRRGERNVGHPGARI